MLSRVEKLCGFCEPLCVELGFMKKKGRYDVYTAFRMFWPLVSSSLNPAGDPQWFASIVSDARAWSCIHLRQLRDNAPGRRASPGQ